jgi:hypothetical protein
MSVFAHFNLSGCVIRQNSGHWCQEALVMCPSLVFLPPRCAVCGVVTVIWPCSCDDEHHGTVTATAGSYRHLLEKLLAPAKHRLCVLHPPSMCCRTFFQHDTFLDRPVRSPDLLVVSRGNEALPQTVSQLQKAMPVFPAGLMYCL